MRCLLLRLSRELGSKQKETMRHPTSGFPLVYLLMVSTSSTPVCASIPLLNIHLILSAMGHLITVSSEISVATLLKMAHLSLNVFLA